MRDVVVWGLGLQGKYEQPVARVTSMMHCTCNGHMQHVYKYSHTTHFSTFYKLILLTELSFGG